LKKLSHNHIDFRRSHKTDYQLVGQTHDLGTAVAESPVHAVVIRAVCFRYTDLAVFDVDHIFPAASVADINLAVNAQIDCVHDLTITEDLGMGSCFAGHQQKDAQPQADS